MSEIRANTVSNAAGTGPVTLTGQYAAKAWVNFDGTGTVAIRESGNVTSITDNGTGDYTTNFTTALADANYSVVCGRQTTTAQNRGKVCNVNTSTTPTTGLVRVTSGEISSVATYTADDSANVFVTVHR